jgi:hypothetical protein
MDDISNTLKKIYDNKGYLDKYGGSLFITFLALFTFFLMYAYFYVMNNMKPIKADWANQRCNPSVIAFAGLINKDPNMSTFEYTGKNFTGCVNDILLQITNGFLKPFYYAFSLMHRILKDLTSTIQNIRKKLTDIIKKFGKIDNEIMNRMFNFLMPIRYIFIKLNDTFQKIQGTLVTSIYSVLSGYMAMKSFIGAFINIMIGVLFSIIAIILPLLLFFFTAPLAIPGLVAFSVVTVFLTTIIIGLKDIVGMTERTLPRKPSMRRCFDENTPIELQNGIIKKIKDISINDILKDGSYVTSIMKLSSEDVTMYKYKNVIVSGTHTIIINNKHMKVCDLENISKIEDYRKPYIYCLNTSNKVIQIGKIFFTDWDEINDNMMFSIRNRLTHKIPNQINYESIHNMLEGGFKSKTQLELIDGSSSSIDKLEVGNILKSGEKILGIIEISTKNIDVKKYYIQGCSKYYKSDDSEDTGESYKTCSIIGGPNNQICDEDLGHFSTLDIKSFSILQNKPEKLYHILTDSGKFMLNGIMFYDYNGCLDAIIS